MSQSGRIIAVDWGTSTLRTYLLDESGTINAETTSKRGILKVSDKRF
ncbi:MAG: 2-dehydro-3-deoxygalactonokinase [Desulfofustis sp. PB-SRB1]|nr:2-dehydro-3-deoxygalactonokinase [Desulfofustis sp. PB-SRB1]